LNSLEAARRPSGGEATRRPPAPLQDGPTSAC